MSLLGYQGLFSQKDKSTGRLEGVALFYKHEKFDLQEARKMIINEIADEIMPQAECREFGEVVILATLRDKITKTLLVIGIEKFHFFKKFRSIVIHCHCHYFSHILVPRMSNSMKSPHKIDKQAEDY